MCFVLFPVVVAGKAPSIRQSKYAQRFFYSYFSFCFFSLCALSKSRDEQVNIRGYNLGGFSLHNSYFQGGKKNHSNNNKYISSETHGYVTHKYKHETTCTKNGPTEMIMVFRAHTCTGGKLANARTCSNDSGGTVHTWSQQRLYGLHAQALANTHMHKYPTHTQAQTQHIHIHIQTLEQDILEKIL